MKRREASHECEICGHEHVHSIEQYRFDTSEMELESVREKGPVTVKIDAYADWTATVEDGYTKIDQRWNSVAGVIVVEAVKQKGGI